MADKPKSRDMTLKVTACRQVYTGNSRNGTSYTIYEVEATKPDGTRVDEKLRAFTSLPIGQDVEVTVVPFKSDRHGRSFTLYPKGGRQGGTGNQLNDLAERVAELENRMRAMFEEWQLVKQQLNSSGAVALVPGRPAPATPPNAELDSKFGGDPPW